MKLSLKNIAITMGLAAGAAIAAVITTKTVKKSNALSSRKPETKQENVRVDSEESDEEVLYV